MIDEYDWISVEELYKRVNTKGKVYIACALIIRDGLVERDSRSKSDEEVR